MNTFFFLDKCVMLMAEKGDLCIFPFLRDNSSYPAAWVFHIAKITGNQMDMNVENRLSGRAAAINADVIAIWGILSI